MLKCNLRRLTMLLITIDVAIALLSPLVAAIMVSVSRTVILSRYRDFDRGGVINHDALQKFEDGSFSHSWTEVPTELTKGLPDFIILGWVESVILTINSITFLMVYCGRRRVWGNTKGSAHNGMKLSGTIHNSAP